MDTRTGKIYSHDELECDHKLRKKLEQHLIQMQIAPTEEQKRSGKVGRNDPCPCGSGKKFKRCHWKPDYALNERVNRLET